MNVSKQMSDTGSAASVDAIVRLEEALREAMLESDVKQLDELIADDLIFTDHTGRLQDKQSDLQAHSSGVLKINELKPLEQIIRCTGDTAVVAVCLAVKGAFDGGEFSNIFRFTRVWVRHEGRWSIVAVHSSVVSES